MMDKLQCEIDRITYHNEKNGYTVVKVNAKGYENIVAAVGTMPEVHVGGSYILRGDWKIDPKYGMQFMFQEYEEILPTTIDGIKKYLGGKLFKGIGPAYAEKIVNFFGEETLNILDDKPERLAETQRPDSAAVPPGGRGDCHSPGRDADSRAVRRLCAEDDCGDCDPAAGGRLDAGNLAVIYPEAV